MSETSIVFTGDIGFDGHMSGRWQDPGLVAPAIRDFLGSADHVIANIEGPVIDLDPSCLKGKLVHSMPTKVCGFLKDLNIDIWSICNNHIMDAGPEGLFSTMDAAYELGVSTVGAGKDYDEASKPLFIEEAGGIGIITVGYRRACREAGEDTPGCFSWSNLELIEKRIKEIKSSCRWCVVIAHAGEEFTSLPSPYTRERLLKFLEFGADLVVTHHPHVPMNYETVGDKAIFYSLGNFIFDTDYQRAQFNTESGILLKVRFSEDSFSFEPFGITVDREAGIVCESGLPDIFTDVREEDYKLLLPLSVKAFIENTKRQWKFLYPDDYNDDTDWVADFYKPLRSGRVPGETLDFQILYPISLEANNNDHLKSSKTKVIEYIKKQLEKTSRTQLIRDFFVFSFYCRLFV